MDFEELHRKVVDWGEARGIFKLGSVDSQLEKLHEELEELREATANKDLGKQIDGIGDMLVVLTMIAHLIRRDLFTCYAAAYLVIRDRKGRMVNGIFVREDSNV
jgi:hypothetical protein